LKGRGRLDCRNRHRHRSAASAAKSCQPAGYSRLAGFRCDGRGDFDRSYRGPNTGVAEIQTDFLSGTGRKNEATVRTPQFRDLVLDEELALLSQEGSMIET